MYAGPKAVTVKVTVIVKYFGIVALVKQLLQYCTLCSDPAYTQYINKILCQQTQGYKIINAEGIGTNDSPHSHALVDEPLHRYATSEYWKASNRLAHS